MITVKIKVFAVLKDYFEPEFVLEGQFSSILDVEKALQEKSPSCAPVLRLSRYAIDHIFVDKNQPIKDHDFLFVMPPSSGG